MKKEGWYKDAIYTYYLDNYPIIIILDNTYHGMPSFSAMIKSYGGSDKYVGVNVSDTNIEILKLKAVLKAKELGWNIKKI